MVFCSGVDPWFPELEVGVPVPAGEMVVPFPIGEAGEPVPIGEGVVPFPIGEVGVPVPIGGVVDIL